MPSDPMKTLYSDNYRALVSLLKAYRDDSKKTQRELAFALGENQSFISRYETGQLRLDFVQLARILDVLGVPLNKFVNDYLALTSRK